MIRELLELIDVEVRELLTKYGYPGDDVPVVRGSALQAMQCGCGKMECAACKSIFELMDAVDAYIPLPVRETDKPFLMSVEDVFSITGRGTVATGRVERGKVKVGDKVQLVGIRETRDTVATGVEMFRKLLDEAQAGDNVGLLLRGIEKEDVERGMVIAAPGSRDASHEVQCGGVRADQGRGRAAQAVLHGIQAAVLLPDDGRDGIDQVARGPRDGDAG